MRGFWAEHAWRPGGPVSEVAIEVREGRIAAVTTGQAREAAVRSGLRALTGAVFPGFVNAHSHAFQRALRGRAQGAGPGSFWTWRERMYALADRLDPDSYLALARATYAEMALAGVTAVGEFHYLHHGPGGARYADPNAMAEALRQAASDAGIRLTLLDTCYLAGGLAPDGTSLPLNPVQLRFSDGDVTSWAARVGALEADHGFRIGAAIHSVRAVPRTALADVVRAVDCLGPMPLHVHVSEQPAENEVCRAAYGCTPTALLAEAGALTPSTTAIHVTHPGDDDIGLLAAGGAGVCLCPTTERDLADGIGPAAELAAAGVRLALGSDQHAVVDLIEEARAVEMDERLRSGHRGRFTPDALVAALTRYDTLGWADTGRIEPGALADLVAIRTDTVRTAGSDPAQLLFAATAADVDTVVVGGEVIVERGRHRLGDVGALLQSAIAPLWTDPPKRERGGSGRGSSRGHGAGQANGAGW